MTLEEELAELKAIFRSDPTCPVCSEDVREEGGGPLSVYHLDCEQAAGKEHAALVLRLHEENNKLKAEVEKLKKGVVTKQEEPIEKDEFHWADQAPRSNKT